MATNKKTKKKKKQAPIVSLKPDNLLVKRGRNMPIYECRVHEGWSDRGNAQVVVARRMPNGKLVVGYYLVDLWCLGLKDTFYHADVSLIEHEEMMERASYDVELQKVEPALAFNLIYAAIEYAEDLGFEAHKDFKYTQYLLPEPDDFEYMDIETGKDGRPCFSPGPNDKVQAILQKLDKKLGKGNYEFMAEFDEDGYDDAYDEQDLAMRGQVIRDFFPETKVDKKMEGLSEADKSEFMLQVIAATLALEMADGSIETLREDYDDDFLEDLTEYFMDNVDGMREEDGLPPLERTESMIDSNRRFLRLIIGRILRHDSVDFMFEEDYKPFSADLTKEEVMNLSPEELSEYLDDTMDMLSEEEHMLATIKMLSYAAIDELFGAEEPVFIDGKMQNEIEKFVWNKLKEDDEDDFFDENDEAFLQKFKEAIADVVDAFNNPKFGE